MKTDVLFYELFTIDPGSLFRLVELELEGEYAFESLTIKTTEKRVDGFCHRIDGCGPNVFLEIQGYDDPTIYWRALREVSTYYEQTQDITPCILVILFLDEQYDPGNCPVLQFAPPHRFLRVNLKPCLKAVGDHAGALTVLKPLICEQKTQVVEEISFWKTEIRSLSLSEKKIRTLLELLDYLIIQRFPTINRKEIEAMLQLTPIEETAIGRELKHLWTTEGRQEGLQEGRQEGLTKGELIGEIRFAQKMLKRPVSPAAALARKSQKALKSMLRELEAELAQRVALQDA